MKFYLCEKCKNRFKPGKYQQVAKKMGKKVFCSRKCNTAFYLEKRPAEVKNRYGEVRGVSNITVHYRDGV